MITQGQATLMGSHIRSSVGLLFVGSFALAMGLLIWHAAFNQNPLANALTSALYQGQDISNL